jgi:hypothetical protein
MSAVVDGDEHDDHGVCQCLRRWYSQIRARLLVDQSTSREVKQEQGQEYEKGKK